MDRLLSRFSLHSAAKPIAKSFPAFDAESLAEIGALELLCPLVIRDRLKDTKQHEELCIDYGLPVECAELAFDEEYLDIFTSIFDETN